MRYFGKRMRSTRFLLVAAAVVVAALAAGGYGYASLTATNNTYTGCLKAGQITNVAVGSSPTSSCVKPGIQISWSETGPPGTNGTNGTSVTSTTLTTGNPNCANGGSSFTSASGTTYACNGAKGDTGPSSLDALQGSPCTYNGHPSTTQVNVDSTSGAVGIVCNPVYEVSLTVTGRTMPFVDLLDETTNSHDNLTDISSASRLIPPGHNVQVQMQTGTIFNGGGFPFSYTCPASSDTPGTHSADAHPGGPGGSGTYYTGACEGVSLSGDFAVTAGG